MASNPSLPSCPSQRPSIPLRKLTDKRPLKIKPIGRWTNFRFGGFWQVGPIFRDDLFHELLGFQGFRVTPSHTDQEVVDKPSDVQKKTRLSGITVKFQGRGGTGVPNHLGKSGMASGFFMNCGEYYCLLCLGEVWSWRGVDWWNWWWWWWWWWWIALFGYVVLFVGWLSVCSLTRCR